MGSNEQKHKPSIFTRLKQIKIEGPEDFSENVDLYLNGEKDTEADVAQPAVGEELAALLDEVANLPYTLHPDGRTDISVRHDDILYPKNGKVP